MDLEKLRAEAAAELAHHRLADWTFALSKAKRRLGACKYQRKRIEIGAYYAAHSPEASVRDTLLHEIAHALAGPEAAHGPAWKAIALRLGATPTACDRSPETVVQPGDWQTTCPACGKTYHRYKRPRFRAGYRCKCPARSPLVFEYAGDPANKPEVPLTAAEAAGWCAKCSACGRDHSKARRPKPGIWKCRCGKGDALLWKYAPRIP